MYKFVSYSSTYRDAWDAYARNHGSFFAQIVWKEILEESFGYKSMYHLIMNEEGKIAGIIPLLQGRNIMLKKTAVSLPFINYVDICCMDDNVIEAAGEWFRNIASAGNADNIEYIELRIKDQRAGLLNVLPDESNCTFIMPLDGSEDDIMGRSDTDNRNLIRKSYKNDFFTISYDKERLSDFYRIYSRRQKQLGSPAFSIDFLKKIMQKLPDNTLLITVIDREKKAVAGGMFIFCYEGTMFYQWGASLVEYNSKHINNYMYWEGMKYGISNGFKYFDFGRSPVNSGTYKFKKQWGAEEVPLQYCLFGKGRHSIPEERRKFQAASEIWKRLPGFITDGAGKVIIKYLMP